MLLIVHVTLCVVCLGVSVFLTTSNVAERRTTAIHSLTSSVKLYKAVVVLLRDAQV